MGPGSMLELWIIVGILIIIVGQLGTIISRNDAIASQAEFSAMDRHWEMFREILGDEKTMELIEKKARREAENDLLRKFG